VFHPLAFGYVEQMKTLNDHWDQIFQKTDDDKLGWFERDYSQTQKFMDKIPNWNKSTIFVPGVGTSGLIELLLKTNASLVLNDLSSKAIEKARKRYPNAEKQIRWICQDISNELPIEPGSVDIWLDRAVLHFLIDSKSIDGYFANVKKVIKSGGHAIFAEFSKSGATRCAGLDVKGYDVQDLSNLLPEFSVIVSEQYNYVNPKGDNRPYIYTLLQKSG
jgi:ubiquinone/menaquinone biosynthesis C-methylase UbiE